MQEVIIDIEGGSPTVTVKGVKGPACKNLTKAVVAALGETHSEVPTPEFYEQVKQTAKASY